MKLLTVFFMLCTAVAVQAQNNIINKLGSGGLFKVYSGGTTKYLCVKDDGASGGKVGIGTDAPGDIFTVVTPNGADSYGLTHANSNGSIKLSTWLKFGGDAYIGTQSSSSIGFFTNATPSAVHLFIRKNGCIGMGTADPLYDLDINGGGTDPLMRFTTLANGTTMSDGMLFGMMNTNGYLNNRENGGIDIYTNNTKRVEIGSTGIVSIGASGATANKLNVYGSAMIGAWATGTVAAPTDGICVSGKVGIGTTAVTDKLEVKTADDSYGITHSGAGPARIGTYVKANGEGWFGTQSPTALCFFTGGVSYPRLYLQFAGNAGFGTTNPLFDLDVQGSNPQIRLTSSALGTTATDGLQIGYTGSTAFINNTEASSLKLYTNNAQVVEINQWGGVGIGTVTAPERLTVLDNIAGYVASVTNTNNSVQSNGLVVQAGMDTAPTTSQPSLISFRRNSGASIGGIVQQSLTSIMYLTGSDRRLKQDITNTSLSLSDLLRIRVRDYHARGDASGRRFSGFIAQELYEVYPDAVCRPARDEDMWSVDYGRITPLLVKAVQEQQAQIEDLRKQISDLQSQLASQEILRQQHGELLQLKAEMLQLKAQLQQSPGSSDTGGGGQSATTSR